MDHILTASCSSDDRDAPAAPAATAEENDAAIALRMLVMGLPAPAAPPAAKLAQMPGATSEWPFFAGKGCFIKSRDGKDLPFLERLYLLLSSREGTRAELLVLALPQLQPTHSMALAVPTPVAAAHYDGHSSRLYLLCTGTVRGR